jgi:anti-sigma-K factor RskA
MSNMDLAWWITAVEAPIVAALFYMINGLRKDVEQRIASGDQRGTDAVHRTREDLAEFKLEVARTYVPLSLIRDVDRRLTQQLLRIEEKLDQVRRGDDA